MLGFAFVLWRHLLSVHSAQGCFLWGKVLDVKVFNLWQVELLWAKNRSWSCNSDPTNKGFSRNLVVLHCVYTDQGASASQASLAMDGNGSGAGLIEMLLARSEELVNDVLGWGRTIGENHVFVLNALVNERFFIVFWVIETHNFGYIQVFKYINVGGSSMSIAMDSISFVDWAHEGQEFAWNDPVEVAIFDFLVVLVFLGIEGFEIIPAKADSFLKTFKTMEDSAIVVTLTLASISVCSNIWVISSELIVSLLCVHLEDNNHKGAHQIAGIRQLYIIITVAVVIYARRALEVVALEKLR